MKRVSITKSDTFFSLSKFRPISDDKNDVSPAQLMLNHITLIVRDTESISQKKDKKPILDVRIYDVKSVEPQYKK